MGKIFQEKLTGDIWRCACGVHIAYNELILSTNFHAPSGDAYLFANVVNVCYGDDRRERMQSGIYMVADLHCIDCFQKLGWIYRHSFTETEKYKESRVVLERVNIHLHRTSS